MEVNMESNDGPIIRLGSNNDSKVVVATPDALQILGSYLQIPVPFIKRLEPDEIQWILNSRLTYTPGTVKIKLANDTISEVHEPDQQVINPLQLVRIAQRTLRDDHAPVIEATMGDIFSFDAIVPTDFTGIGTPEVGDITRAGLRFEQNRKHNLSPTVMPYSYSLWCTNGMETYKPGLKVDARGLNVEDVLVELSLKADQAFKEVEDQIRALTDMKTARITNPERTLITMAQENGISDRMAMSMVHRLPAVIEDDNQATMFDIVNLVTNHANKPGMRFAQRRELERLGGIITSAHVARCSHCKHKIKE
jgi:hypothetical protein